MKMRNPKMKLFSCGLLLTGMMLAQDGFQPLFNGKNLDDWIVDTPGMWSVRDGTIVGKSPGVNYNEYLCTKKQYSDFILKVKMRIIDGKGNSGIQFRSRFAGRPHVVEGPQADAGKLPVIGNLWGLLYCELRHKVLAPIDLPGQRKPVTDQQPRILDARDLPEEQAVLRLLTLGLQQGKYKAFGPESRPHWYRQFLSKMDLTAWHEYVITAQGKHIVVELDGVRTADYYENDPEIDRFGFVALQLHGFKESYEPNYLPLEVHFKDLWIKPLSLGVSADRHTPADLYRINAGGSVYTDSKGQIWIADGYHNLGSLDVTTNKIAGTEDQALYQTERYGPPKQPELQYQFPVPGAGSYRVRLHFAETYPPTKAKGARVFNVRVEGKMAFEKLDIFAEAGPDKALIKTCDVNVADSVLNLDFEHVVENPKINAIEIIDITGKKR
jgi:hypothetical protein